MKQKGDRKMLGRLYVIINSNKEEDCEMIKDQLSKIRSDFSFSPSREYPAQKGASDFFATCDLDEEEVQPLLDQLNNDWDGDVDDCICYGFNTKMFHPLVYFLEFTYFH